MSVRFLLISRLIVSYMYNIAILRMDIFQVKNQCVVTSFVNTSPLQYGGFRRRLHRRRMSLT